MGSAFSITKGSVVNSGIDAICLGTAQFGSCYGIANDAGQIRASEAKEIISTASRFGIRTLDTAIAYGESESMLGSIGVDGWEVVTKLPGVPEGCCDVRAWLASQVHGSLQRLGICKLHAILLHRPEQLLGNLGSELAAGLESMKRQGLVSKIGVSIYSADELGSICALFKPDIVQCPVNILDRRLDASGWLGRLSSNGVEVHARSVFLQGLLLMPRNTIPSKFRRWAGLLDEWHSWLAENDAPSQEVCLSYVRSLSGINKIVVGVDNVAQLRLLASHMSGPARHHLPTLYCNDVELINPSLWDKL
jgi:aryl-alcohol dehydrogenase-like predicted oxidoreductase